MKKIICLIASFGLMFLNMSAYAGTVAWATGDRGSGAYEAYVITDEGLKIGNGTPTVTMDGEDAYVEGTFEVDGATRLDGAVTLTGAISTSSTLTTSSKRVITPGTQTGITTSSQVVITSEFMVISPTGTLTNVADPLISTATVTNPNGTRVILMGGSSNVLTLTETTTFVLGAATRALGLGDILELIIYSGAWYELGFTDN